MAPHLLKTFNPTLCACLEEEVLFIEEDHVRHLPLQIEGVVFAYREMESCVRMD